MNIVTNSLNVLSPLVLLVVVAVAHAQQKSQDFLFVETAIEQKSQELRSVKYKFYVLDDRTSGNSVSTTEVTGWKVKSGEYWQSEHESITKQKIKNEDPKDNPDSYKLKVRAFLGETQFGYVLLKNENTAHLFLHENIAQLSDKEKTLVQKFSGFDILDNGFMHIEESLPKGQAVEANTPRWAHDIRRTSSSNFSIKGWVGKDDKNVKLRSFSEFDGEKGLFIKKTLSLPNGKTAIEIIVTPRKDQNSGIWYPAVIEQIHYNGGEPNNVYRKMRFQMHDFIVLKGLSKSYFSVSALYLADNAVVMKFDETGKLVSE